MTPRLPTLRETVGSFGAVLLALAVVVVFAPDVLPPVVLEVASALREAVDSWMVMLGLAGLVFLYALYRFQRSKPGRVERLVDEEETEAVPDVDDDVDFDTSRPGRDFDYAVARARARIEHAPNAEVWEASQIDETLREGVVAVRTTQERDEAAVVDEIDDGSWTDDRVAAAFLGGDDAPGMGLWRRLYAWLYPARAFERRIERVVAEIERQASVPARDGEADSGGGGRTDGPDATGEGVGA